MSACRRRQSFPLYKVVNEKNKVTLIKQDEQKNPLEGAVFKLEKKSGDGTFTTIRTSIKLLPKDSFVRLV